MLSHGHGPPLLAFRGVGDLVCHCCCFGCRTALAIYLNSTVQCSSPACEFLLAFLAITDSTFTGLQVCLRCCACVWRSKRLGLPCRGVTGDREHHPSFSSCHSAFLVSPCARATASTAARLRPLGLESASLAARFPTSGPARAQCLSCRVPASWCRTAISQTPTRTALEELCVQRQRSRYARSRARELGKELARSTRSRRPFFLQYPFRQRRVWCGSRPRRRRRPLFLPLRLRLCCHPFPLPGQVTIDGCRFLDCAAQDSGGCVALDSIPSATVSGCDFDGCIASNGSGGALAFTLGTASPGQKLVYTVGNGTTIANSRAALNGGAVLVQVCRRSQSTLALPTPRDRTSLRCRAVHTDCLLSNCFGLCPTF